MDSGAFSFDGAPVPAGVTAADHAPGIAATDVTFGPNCPVAHDATVRLGWTHDTYFLRIRNLVFLPHGNDLTDHCRGFVWQRGRTLELSDFVDMSTRPYLGLVEIRCISQNDVQTGLVFRHPATPPRDLRPLVYHVEMRLRKDGRLLDSFWLVLSSRVSMLKFEAWTNQNLADLDWVSELPRPTPTIDPSNPAGTSVLRWKAPAPCSSYLHHSASFEMRSEKTPGGHGNQACYDAAGGIILSGISGGTADKAYASAENVFSHVEQDVEPFLRALQLDGNPGIPDFMNNISRPCLYEGSCLRNYLLCRPITPPE